MNNFDLEIVGEVRELTEPETPVRKDRALKKLRASHHPVARLLARNMSVPTVSAQTGYSIQGIMALERDDMFRELVEHYRRDNTEIAIMVEHQFLGVAQDARQIIQERLHEAPEDLSTETVLDIFKAMADRAGYAPVQRSVNKNLNLNIGARLDAARQRKQGDEG